ncbi:hypothetical protein LCGC14_0431980 [marine sediment metagenome]|uniref:Putative zinc-finger domain-containing protein n=1 Tax=marine sediment metagenome TaxID=412755 RepID=A0A0F9T647_9ZZZZ|nr:hypothetical protein [Phycisphaerae bacterium]HDZ44336.1 hypothetical protein [Phycisphaerae bacterium]
MSCETIQPLITGYLDGELSADQQTELDAHLAQCEQCRRDLEELRQLKDNLAGMSFREPGDEELDRYWQGVYNRLERGTGWVLLSIGAICLLSFGAFMLVERVVRDPDVAWIVKIGVTALIIGAVVLFVSLLRERLAVRKTDRYAKEIKR